MVALNAGDNVGVQVVPQQAGAVTVQHAPVKRPELGQHLGLPRDDVRVVHDLGQPQHPTAAEQNPEVGGIERGAGGFHVRRRDAA